MDANYLSSILKQFLYYKKLGEGAIAQLTEEELFWQQDEENNSIAMIISHLSGNMLSRFTDFLTSDGEKPTRNRDIEFEPDRKSRKEVMHVWEQGWSCLLENIQQLKEEDLATVVYIRNEGHTVVEAINRQLAHYPYHVGQIVCIAKIIVGKKWKSLSIPRNQSDRYNKEKFSKDKSITHFTDKV